MLPKLLTTPFFAIRPLPLFIVLSLIVSLFFFWRKAREEHYDEALMFDAFFLSAIMGFFLARLAYIIFNFHQFGFSLLSWLDVFGHPGSYLFAGLIGSALYISRFSHNQKWDQYEVLDFWSIAVVAGFVVLYLGMFFDGSQYGTATTLPWGIVFPGLLEKHHPLQLYKVFSFSLLVWYLSWVELRYRTYDWYRVGKRNAQTGFLLAVFLLAVGLIHLVLYPISSVGLTIFKIPVYLLGSFLSIFLGVVIMLIRSGRIFLKK